MRNSTATRRRLAVPLAVVGCAVAVAGCGSASKSHDASNGGIKFADCMRSHGVSNFPDPSAGGGIQIPQGSGINPSAPAFQSAQKTCSKLLPGGGPGGRQASEAQKLQMLRLSQCMRKHGVTSFPDPTTKAPSPGSGFGIAFGGAGSFIAVPQNMLQSPGFKQAAATCHFPGFGAGGGPKASPAG